MTIHRKGVAAYWYYWVIIVGGVIFVIAAYATNGFGTGAV